MTKNPKIKDIFLNAIKAFFRIKFEGKIRTNLPNIFNLNWWEEISENVPELAGKFATEMPKNGAKLPFQGDQKMAATIDLKKDIHEYSSIFAVNIKKLYRKIRQQNLKIYYLEQENKRLQQLAFLDDLTQLANRRQFYLYLKQNWQADPNRPISLILGDVDFFKAYNDNYGHLAGDLCLQRIADAIQEALSSCETSTAYLAARYGGEEFAIVLPDTESEKAMEIAEKIRLNIAAQKIPHVGSSIEAWITLSAGVSTRKAGRDVSPEMLILGADRALYQAKQRGRNRAFPDT
jgi:diguanylate cyclase (GGDEF)-like protein